MKEDNDFKIIHYFGSNYFEADRSRMARDNSMIVDYLLSKLITVKKGT